MKHCIGFKTKITEECKTLLKDAGICYRCCSSSKHLTKECKVTVKCKECKSDALIAALHPGPAPWNNKIPESDNGEEEKGGEERGEPSPTVNSKCTEVCGENNSPHTCSKICLIAVHPNGELDKSVRLYAIVDDQSIFSIF